MDNLKYMYEQTKYALKQKINELFTDDLKIFGTKNYENARQIMTDCHLTVDIIERVIDVISEISFKGTETIVPKSIEGKIVQDAD